MKVRWFLTGLGSVVIFFGLLLVLANLSFGQNAVIEEQEMPSPTIDSQKDLNSNANEITSETEDMDQEEESTEVGSKICPVDGTLIKEGEGYPVEYKNKTYYVCSKECEKDFREDPEAYIGQDLQNLDESEMEEQSPPEEKEEMGEERKSEQENSQDQ